MRCRLGKKKIRKFERLLGKEIDTILTRGNTRHRYDVWFSDGKTCSVYPDTIKELERLKGEDDDGFASLLRRLQEDTGW